MVPDFISSDNGIQIGNNDDNIADNAAEPPDDENDEHQPVVSNHGHSYDSGEVRNRAEERGGDEK
jgi:hypothetical protein